MANHILVGYFELKNVKLNEKDLRELLSSFNRNSTFHFLTMINNFLSLFPPNFNNGKEFIEVQRFLCVNLLDDELLNLTNQKLKNISPFERPLFSRWQILYLMKRVLTDCPVNGELDVSSQENKTNRYLLGKACLITNDLLTTEEQNELLKYGDSSNPDEAKRILQELLAQMLVMSELMNPPEIRDAIVRTSKYIDISKKYFPNFYNDYCLSDYFESLTGINLETFIELNLTINTWFIIQKLTDLQNDPVKVNLNKEKWFSNLTYDSEIEPFFNLTSCNISDLVIELNTSTSKLSLHPNYDFRVFRNSPILFLNNQSFTIIDHGFLVEKVSFGLFHTILNVLPNDKKIRRAFFQHWGKIFEVYVNNIFQTIYPKLSNRFFPNTFFESKEAKEAFDGIIEYSDSLIVMEYKGGSLNAEAKYSGNKELLLSDLNRKFGLHQRDSGVKQIVRKIEMLFASNEKHRFKLKELEFKNVKFIHPILIVNETCLEFGLASWQLRQWFNEQIKQCNLQENIQVKNLMVLSISMLELLTSYIESGDFTLLDFATFYSETIENQVAITLREVFTDFRDKKNIKFRENKNANFEFDSFVENIIKKFKPEIL